MRARAVWSRLRYFTPQQRLKAARETRSLRKPEVALVVLAEAGEVTRNEPKLAEEWVGFGIQLLDLIPERLLATDRRNELRGAAFSHLGNALRVGGSYQGAVAALQKASDLLNGTANEHHAHLLSVQASLKYDLGDIEGAVERLNRAQEIHSELRNRTGIALLGVQHANFLRETSPSEARTIANEALFLLPRTEFRLEMLARCVIAECLVEEHDGHGALLRLEETRPLCRQFQEVWVNSRVQLLEAYILDELGYIADAERLYVELARSLWIREMYRESYIVRLRLVEFLVKRKRTREAAEVCRQAVLMLSETRVHRQMGDVWQALFEAAEAQALKLEIIPSIREYMVRHWRVPAEHPPAIGA